MKRFLFAASTILLLACGKSAQEKADDLVLCSNTERTGRGITQCLLNLGGWSRAAAESAGAARQHELDSTNAEIAAIAARTKAERRGQVGQCDAKLVDMKDCLVNRFGWEPFSAAQADESVWVSRGKLHAREIRACGAPRSGTGACLQLHYKWIPRRALAVDDSLRRAH